MDNIENKKSIKKNFVYNMILTLLNLIFPLITFPYVSRILGSTGVGKVDFANSILQYFILIGTLGLPIYGVREIAKVKYSFEERSRVFSELFIIGLISNVLSTLSLVFIINSVPKIIAEQKLFYVLLVNMFLNIFSLDWLFQGLEEYRFITIRSIIVKILSMIFLFVFIRNKEQYVLYGLVSVISISGSNLLNAFSLRRYVKLTLKNIDLKKHIKPLLIIFSSSFATSIYMYLNSSMLGFLAGDSHVGYYAAANKLNRIVISVVASLVVVVTPRISYYFNEKLLKEVNNIIKFSISFVFCVAIPATFGLALLAPQAILVFSGKDFIPSIITMRLINPIIIVVGLCNVTSTLILIPMNKEKCVLKSVVLGAITNCAANFILIPTLYENGAAIATVLSEVVVLGVQMYYSRELLRGKILNKQNFLYLSSSIVMSIVVYLIGIIIKTPFLSLLIGIALGGITYIVILILFKDHIIFEVLKPLKIFNIKTGRDSFE